jgi:hypothetical protein
MTTVPNVRCVVIAARLPGSSQWPKVVVALMNLPEPATLAT